MPVTLKDLAQRAGVSISTVSRIINNDEKKPANRKTAEKVWKLAGEMGYVPNVEARRLKGLNTDSTAKVIGCILASNDDSLSDPFFISILKGVQSEAVAHGFSVGYTFSFAENSDAFLQNTLAQKVDGIVLMGRMSDERLRLIQSHFSNIVYTGINRLDRGFDEVICNSYEATLSVIEYLVSLGHRQIGFIGCIPQAGQNEIINEHRYRAYLDGMMKHRLKISQNLIRNSVFTAAAGFEAMTSILQSGIRPSAVFCANDSIAIGAMKAIRDTSLSVPEDISLVGINDIELAQFVQPPLTTIRVPTEEMGAFAVKLLIDQINKTRQISCCTTLPFKLVVRESCSERKADYSNH